MAAERRRIVYFTRPGAPPTAIQDFQDGQRFFSQRDSFQIQRPDRKTVFANSSRRYGGAIAVDEIHDNTIISWKPFVAGVTADDVNRYLEIAFGILESTRRDLYFEWRPEGATHSLFYEIRGPAMWNVGYSRPLYSGADAFLCDIAIPVGPLAEGLPMFTYEDFTTADTIGQVDWTILAGASTFTTSGAIVPADTTNKTFLLPQRGYEYNNGMMIIDLGTGAAVTNTDIRAIIKRRGNGDYLCARWVANTLHIAKVVGGTPTSLASVAATLATSNINYLCIRQEDNQVYAWLENTGADPEEYVTSTPVNVLTHQLSTADANTYGRDQVGSWGVYWTPHSTSETIKRIRHYPFTFANGTHGGNGGSGVRIETPDTWWLRYIGGNAPAKVDFSVTATGVTPWGLLSWQKFQADTTFNLPLAWNMCWNGGFYSAGANSTSGWRVTAIAGVVGAGTSVTAGATPYYLNNETSLHIFGSAADVVCPATAGTGCHFAMFGKFKKGVPYTCTMWVRSAAQTTNFKVVLGASGNQASSSSANLSTTWTQYTVTWVPSADVNEAYIAPQINAATATTFQISRVVCYEGTQAPVDVAHLRGFGAHPPFGRIMASHYDTITNWTYNGSLGLVDNTVSGAETWVSTHYLDPGLLTPDDFTDETIDIEIWGSFTTHASNVNPKCVVHAIAEGVSSGVERYTVEYGNVGRFLPKPSSSTARRVSRLGTITLPVGPPGMIAGLGGQNTARVRWKLVFTVTTQAGSSGSIAFHEFYLNPARQRAVGPTGKPNDSTYPKMLRADGEIKTITYDLKGRVKPLRLPEAADVGLGGQQLEFPPGNVCTFLKVGLVPDDPTSDTTTDAGTVSARQIRFNVTPRYWAVK